MTTPESLYLVGCGDLALRLCAVLPAGRYRAVGVCRSPARLPAALAGIAADYTRPGDLDFLGGKSPDLVVATFVPAAYTEEGYRAGFSDAMSNLLAGLAACRPRLTIMVSSTRVYAEQAGRWVDEDSPLATGEPRAEAIISAERQLLQSGLACAVVRCGGIYGDPHGRLLARLAAGKLSAPEPVRYSNRIHRDDAAGFLAHLLASRPADVAPVYNCVDDCPAPVQEVEAWLAERLGGACTETATHLPAGETSHKRCRNTPLHESGYRLRYPDYRSGYAAVLSERRGLD
jgi:nucleoside-diphosphate-sugar epimerase